jgi:hypothetical protein
MAHLSAALAWDAPGMQLSCWTVIWSSARESGSKPCSTSVRV